VSKPLIGLLAVCVAIAMIVGGCGGGDDTTDSTATADSPELTKAQFLKQGNAICAKANEELNGEVAKFFKENGLGEKQQPSTAELTEVAEDFVTPIVGRQVEEIRQLGSPAGEEQQVEKILSAAEEGIKKSEEDPDSLLAGENSAFGKANQLAKEYGLKTCGE
jgi:hypothetical protein